MYQFIRWIRNQQVVELADSSFMVTVFSQEDDERDIDTSVGGDSNGESFISISYWKGCKSYASFEVTDLYNTSDKSASADDNVLSTKEIQMYCIPMSQARKSD